MGCEEPFVASRENDTEKSGVRMQRRVDRDKQLELLRRRYQGRGKQGKARLLDEFCEHYGYERKYAIKLLGAQAEELAQKHSPPGPDAPARARRPPAEHTAGPVRRLIGVCAC